MRSATAWDTTIAIVTPENIAFDYELAGPFRRVPAYAIDVAMRWLAILLLYFLLTLAVLQVFHWAFNPGWSLRRILDDHLLLDQLVLWNVL